MWSLPLSRLPILFLISCRRSSPSSPPPDFFSLSMRPSLSHPSSASSLFVTLARSHLPPSFPSAPPLLPFLFPPFSLPFHHPFSISNLPPTLSPVLSHFLPFLSFSFHPSSVMFSHQKATITSNRL